jgi:ubiquinone/menaquinone biosynthesis C-methylase UbiE
MKYDATSLPAAYDRARARSPEMIALWMNAVASHVHTARPITSVADVGCGTGRFAEPLQSRFQARVIGIDPSREMLKRAIQKSAGERVQYVIGQGEDIPLRGDSMDLVFMSMVFHHFSDVSRVLGECRRVLRPGGFVFLRAGTADRIPFYPLTRYFPASVPIMERTLVSCKAIRDSFESCGFRTAYSGVLQQEIAASHAVYADQLAAGGDSVLIQLDRSDFEAGLEALRSYAAVADPLPVTEPLDFFVFVKTD